MGLKNKLSDVNEIFGNIAQRSSARRQVLRRHGHVAMKR